MANKKIINQYPNFSMVDPKTYSNLYTPEKNETQNGPGQAPEQRAGDEEDAWEDYIEGGMMRKIPVGRISL